MLIPKDILSGSYTKPQVILCEVDKTKICSIDTQDLNGTFKFNSYSEITFTVSRVYTDVISGETKIFPFYDKIEALRLLYLPGFGYFEIQDPKISSDGIVETKEVNAFSYEYSLSQKYLDTFVINTPDNESNIGGGTPSSDEDDPVVQFYNQSDVGHSLLHLATEKAYGWTIGHVDQQLKTQTRSFEVDRSSIYDFLVNDVSKTFKCYFIFDTVNNIINVYAESVSVKFYGNGSTRSFELAEKFDTIGSVTINGYKTTAYTYNNSTGIIVFAEAPESQAIIEVEDGSQSQWDTDVFVSFENLATQMDISYSADDIKTKIKVSGSDDMNIRDVNMGLDYIMDLSFYHTVDWMGQDLYGAYNNYLQLVATKTPVYTGYLTQMQTLWDEYYNIQNKTSVDLTAYKIGHLKTMLQSFYKNKNITIEKIDSRSIAEVIREEFEFIGIDKVNAYLEILVASSSIDDVEYHTKQFMKDVWSYYGISMLNVNVDSFTNIQETHIDSGWSVKESENYYMYWANYMMLSTCTTALNKTKQGLQEKQDLIDALQNRMDVVSDQVAMENNFTEQQLIKLYAFIREDEYSDSNFVITDIDTNDTIIKAKQELLQCGQIELGNLCQPKLSFSGTLANIYALDEFAPIVSQFQLGNLVRISLRSDYIKKARLMEVRINFDDFSDFDVEFGDLISTRSQIDIHADLLNKAAQAGKSVAANEAKWQKAVDKITATEAKIQNGLLDAATTIKSIDGTQGVEIDEYGIHLKKIDPETGEADPKQVWLINNLLCYTDDNWKTTRSALGEFNYDGQTYYGLLAQAVIAGYIEGSKIKGGTIQIGDRGDGTYNFEVDEVGTVIMRGGKGVDKTVTDLVDQIQETQESILTINQNKMYRIEIQSLDRSIMTSKNQTATLTCKVYSWDQDITATLDASLFNWVRSSKNPTFDAAWNEMAIHKGTKTLTISTEDIMYNASFSCQVNLPD